MPSTHTTTIIKPRFLPRRFSDFLITCLIAFPLQAIGLFITPSLLAFAVSGSMGMALLVAAFIYILFLSHSVWNVALTVDGIRFRRLCGSPRLVAWHDVASIVEVPRSELIIKGWLWPLFPAREMTACLSSERHYRISWHEGYCYFPPADPEGFEHHVSKHLQRREA